MSISIANKTFFECAEYYINYYQKPYIAETLCRFGVKYSIQDILLGFSPTIPLVVTVKLYEIKKMYNLYCGDLEGYFEKVQMEYAHGCNMKSQEGPKTIFKEIEVCWKYALPNIYNFLTILVILLITTCENERKGVWGWKRIGI